jgi:tripartite-type tricarboxylate transporter receptor subunit TctC
VLALMLAGAGHALAQYPAKPVSMIVPFAAGGPTDTVARTLGAAMQNHLKQTVIVENVGGAGGTLGAEKVARAANDGYTILLHHIGMSTAPALYRNLRYKPLEDFEPIGEVTDVPMTLVGRANLPAANFKELLAYVKANKEKVNYGNAGLGSASHLCGLLFMSAIQVDMTTVPYKGTGPAMNDLLGGTLDLMCDQTTNTTSQIKGGQGQGFRGHDGEACAFAQHPADAAGGRPEGLRGRGVARAVRAQGHAQAGDRQAGGGAAGRAQGPERRAAVR